MAQLILFVEHQIGDPLWTQVIVGCIAAMLVLNKVLDMIGKRRGGGSPVDVVKSIEELQEKKQLRDCLDELVDHMRNENRLSAVISDNIGTLCERLADFSSNTRLAHDRIEMKLENLAQKTEGLSCRYPPDG